MTLYNTLNNKYIQNKDNFLTIGMKRFGDTVV